MPARNEKGVTKIATPIKRRWVEMRRRSTQPVLLLLTFPPYSLVSRHSGSA